MTFARGIAATSAQAAERAGSGFLLFAGLAIGLSAFRIVALRFATIDLDIDEAQYWSWSRDLDFGYFSKPPMIAWIIAGADLLCGSGEACIRSPAPVLYLLSAFCVHAVAARLYGPRVAFWSGLAFLTAPAVVVSARLITTDVPLIFFWCLALLAFVRLRARPTVFDGLLLGLALGFGLLSKYAMIYFAAGIVVAALADPPSRAVLAGRPFWLALAAAAAVVAPNVAWNLEHGLISLVHVGRETTEGGLRFHPAEGFEFLFSQLGIAGPVMALASIGGLVAAARSDALPADRLMAAFCLPTIALVTVTAFSVERAEANWAATAFVSAVPLSVALLLRLRLLPLVAISVALGLLVQAFMLSGDRSPGQVDVPGTSKNPFRAWMGWHEIAGLAVARAGRAGAVALLAEHRQDVSALLYYARDSGLPVYVWPKSAAPENHYEMTRPLGRAAPEPLLFVSRCENPDRLRPHFSEVVPLGPAVVERGPGLRRPYWLFRLAGRRDGSALLGRCG